MLDDSSGDEDELTAQLFGNIESSPLVPDFKEVEDEDEIVAKVGQKRKAAWFDDTESGCVSLQGRNLLKKLRVDESEDATSMKVFGERLQEQFLKLNKGNPAWANWEEDSESEDDVLQSTGGLVKKRKALEPLQISVQRMKDITLKSPHKGQISSVEFHPEGRLVLTAGLDKTLKIWSVDGYENVLLQSAHFKDMPITCAHFTVDGKEVFLSGRRRFFYVYNLESRKITKIPKIQGRKEKSFEYFVVSPDNRFILFTGKSGSVLVISRKSKRLVRCLKLGGQIRSLSFSGNTLFAFGIDGEICAVNMKNFQCKSKIKDEWNGTCIDVDKQRLVTANESGIVNIYQRGKLEPYKSLPNLTTKVTGIKLNHDSQLMVYFSRMKKDALRLVHLSSGSVYSNWPHASTPLNYVNSVSFSPGSAFLAIGNARGIAMLYRLKHFDKI